MKSYWKKKIKGLLNRGAADAWKPRLSPADESIVAKCLRYSMTGSARLTSLLDSVDYVTRRNIPGAFVECGVWRGGSVLAMIEKLLQLGITGRDIYLYDTFEGMTTPGRHDLSAFDRPALDVWKEAQRRGEKAWSNFFRTEVFNEDTVRELLYGTGYPKDRLHFVRGPVETTIPGVVPPQVALLRLDTDWYDSTRHEMAHLYPRLQDGGVLIVDDYGHWDGCRRAVDEYFANNAAPVLLNRVDYSCRIAIKH
ncbi:MAG: class I SAM-dependent methyltransferase [Gammaproteobacteria bacterium]|nr:class I SAM-dependent methyltransferase [Gammaproteobacteria bacterium]